MEVATPDDTAEEKEQGTKDAGDVDVDESTFVTVVASDAEVDTAQGSEAGAIPPDGSVPVTPPGPLDEDFRPDGEFFSSVLFIILINHFSSSFLGDIICR